MTQHKELETMVQAVMDVWKTGGIPPEPVQDDLAAYWQHAATLGPMDAARSGDISQKAWDWSNRLLDGMPAGLKTALKDWRSDASVSLAGKKWKPILNESIETQKQPLVRFTWTQAIIPLLTPLLDVDEIPFIRFEDAVGTHKDVSKAVNEEISQALQDEDRFYQRNSYNNAYGGRNSALDNAERHYASLSGPLLIACADQGLIAPEALLAAFFIPGDHLNIKNLYPGDSSHGYQDGNSGQLFRFFVPGHREEFLAVQAEMDLLETGHLLFQTRSFIELIETDDALFEAFLKNMGKDFFEKEYERMNMSHRIPINRWQAYAAAADAHGFILAPYVHDRDKEYPEGLVGWYRDRLADDLEYNDRYTLFRFLAFFESSDTVMDYYRRMKADEINYGQYSEYHMGHIVKNIKDPALLAEVILSDDKKVRNLARQEYMTLKRSEPWTEFHDLAAQKPEAFLDQGAMYSYRLPSHDPKLLDILWEASAGMEKEETLRELVLSSILSSPYSRSEKIPDDRYEALKKLAHKAIDAMPDAARKNLLEDTYVYMDQIEWYERFNHPLVNSLILRVVAAGDSFKDCVKEGENRHDEDKWVDKIRKLVQAKPEDLLSLTPHQLRMVLTFFDAEKELAELSPHIHKQAAGTTSAELHLFLADWLAPVPYSELERLGWLDKKFRRFEAVSVEILLRKSEPEALDRLQAEYKKIKNQTLKDRILDRLEEDGRDTSALDEFAQLPIEELDRIAAKKIPKKMKAAVKKIWDENLTETFHPLTESMLKWLFKLCEETTADSVPRTGKRLLALLSREQQAALTFYLFEKWFDNKGHASLEWAVLLIKEYGDDRLVPLFLKSVKHWNKKSKPKSNKVIGWMGKLGSVYALSEVKNIYEGRFSESIIRQAKTVLTDVARERGQTLPELFEELTPTLDYTHEGLVLDAGPRKYLARILSDGSLTIIHEGGKTTKSFPKQKKDEDAALYKASKSKLSFFKKNLKPIIKQQQINFSRYLNQGKTWEADRWKKLFMEHPLLGALGQSLIWKGRTNGEEEVSFRLSEDYSLITVEDDVVEAANLKIVGLWHPIEAAEDEIAAWRDHLADYELKPFIEQVDAPVHRLEDDESDMKQMTRYQGHVTHQGSFKGILKKHGWFQEETGDGGNFYAHYFPSPELLITLHHSRMTAWMEPEEPTAIDHVVFYDRKEKTEVALSAVPPRLISWVNSVLADISAKGEGYQTDWQSLL